MARDKKKRPKTATTTTKKAAPRVNVRAALGLKKLPDPVKLGQLRDLVRNFNVPQLGGDDSSTLSAVVETKTEEQKVMENCGLWYKRLSEESPRVTTAIAAMLGLRRAYAVAYRELNDAVEEYRAGGHRDEPSSPVERSEQIPVEFQDFAVQYAMWMAAKPFNEHQMMSGVIDTVLPWLADVVDRHTAVDTAEARDEQVARNEARRNTALPIGLKHNPHQSDLTQPRDKALVLVGWKNAVQWLLDQIAAEVLKAEQQFNAVRMLTTAPNPADQHARLLRLAPSAWNGCANSDRDVDGMVARFIQPSVGGQIDLVMFDDLSAAHTAGFVGRNRFAQAGDAHRRLRKWCDGMGSGLIAAVPLDSPELPEMSGVEFEQLKTFAALRIVTVQDGVDFEQDGNYRITVGTNASVFDVPKSVLDNYGSSRLIVPRDMIT